MKKYKAPYKVAKYFINASNEVIRVNECLEVKPKINDFVNDFAPKLSTCYSIQMFELQDNNHYKMIESWFKTKRGWKRVC